MILYKDYPNGKEDGEVGFPLEGLVSQNFMGHVKSWTQNNDGSVKWEDISQDKQFRERDCDPTMRGSEDPKVYGLSQLDAINLQKFYSCLGTLFY